MPVSSNWSPPFKYSTKMLYAFLAFLMSGHISSQAHPLWFDHPNICWRGQTMKFCNMQYSSAFCYFLSLRYK
jgi:hypothetical protein